VGDAVTDPHVGKIERAHIDGDPHPIGKRRHRSNASHADHDSRKHPALPLRS
jgi:hypothetical protein